MPTPPPQLPRVHRRHRGVVAIAFVTLAITLIGCNLIPTLTDPTSRNSAPQVVAGASPDSGIAPLTVSLTGAATDSDGTIAAYLWNFGDGASSTVVVNEHIYRNPGTYTATLMASDNRGATAISTVMIRATAVTGNQPPTAIASATPTSGPAPLAVSFAGSGSDPDGTIASNAWTFGDGGTSSQQNPSHTYIAAGSYTARLTVTDNQGATGSTSVSVITTGSANIAPVANAGSDQLNKDPGNMFTLSGTGSSDPDGAIASYAWTQIAGPPVTLTGANTATPSFASPARTSASFSFRLTVTDNGSPAQSATATVAVSTRVTYDNTVGALLLSRGTQSSGRELGCTASGCHTGSGGLSPLSTYSQVFSARSGVKSKISSGGSMLKFLLSGEAPVIIGWIDAGAPQKN